MAELTDEDYEAANERGRILFEDQPHAKAVRYDIRSGMIVVDLYNDCTFAFPPRRLQGLEDASDDELSEVETIGAGVGLHWESRDADFTIGGLMAGRFGSEAYMQRERMRRRAMLGGGDPQTDAA